MLTAREDKELRALKNRRLRAESGRFLAEGMRVVEDLLASPIPVRYIVASSTLEDGDRGARLLESARRRGVPIHPLPEREFDRLAATDSPQGILAVADAPELSLETIAGGSGPSVVVLLDAVQDPGNFGTMIRSAEAFGAAAVIALEGTVDPWNPKSVRSSAGSSFRVPIVESTREAAVGHLRRAGYAVVGASMEGEPVGGLGPGRWGLVLGNEGAGLSPSVRADLDRVVAVPTPGRAESLNVAAAAAILLYELTGAGKNAGIGSTSAESG